MELSDDGSLLEFCTTLVDEIVTCMVIGESVDQDRLSKIGTHVYCLQQNHPWASKLIYCMEVHFKAATQWRMFLEDSRTNEKLMKDIIFAGEDAFYDNKEDAQGIKNVADAMKHISIILKQLPKSLHRVNQLSSKLPMMKERLQNQNDDNYAVMICPLKTKEVSIPGGEEMKLIDNSDRILWKVKRYEDGKTYTIPSVLLLIPGPDYSALDKAEKFTASIKDFMTGAKDRYQETFGPFIIPVLRRFLNNKVVDAFDRQQLTRFTDVLDVVGILLDEYMSNAHTGNLRNIYEELRKEVKAKGHGDIEKGDEFSEELDHLECIVNTVIEVMEFSVEDITVQNGGKLVPSESLENMLEGGKKMNDESNNGVEPYKIKIRSKNASNSPETSSNRMRRKWELHYISRQIDKTEEITYIPPEKSHRQGWSESCDTQFGIQSRHAVTEQLLKYSGEVRKKFFIEAIIDPRDGSSISMDEAKKLGILDQSNGVYVNIDTGERIPIPAAMEDGLIIVTYESPEDKREVEEESMGIVTLRTNQVKTMRERYTVREVIHPVTGVKMTLEEALHEGILDHDLTAYRNPKTGNELLIPEAMERGLIIADGTSEGKEDETDADEKSFVIGAVVDRRLKRRVSFREAQKRGLIDKESGAYVDNLTGKKMFVTEAIEKGFLKVKAIDDPNKLDIDPENKIMVHRVDVIKKKLIKPLRVIQAFRMARMLGKIKEEHH